MPTTPVWTRAARVSVRTRIAERPDHVVRLALALRTWHRTPAACLTAAAAAHGTRPALVDDAGAVTFAALDATSTAIARGLRQQGLGPGDQVAVMCRNHRGFAHAVLAASKLGAHVLLLNTDFAGPQLVELLAREPPALIVNDAEFGTLFEGAPALRVEAERELVALAATGPLAPPPAPGRITILSSGTTGTPKGVRRPGATPLGPLVALLDRIPLRAREPHVLAAPMFHGWGFLNFGLGLLLGTTTIVSRRFDPEATLAAIARHRATCAPMVPLMLARVIDAANVHHRYDTTSLRALPLAGSAIPGGLPERAMNALGDIVYNIYGSTECALATVATPADLRAAPTTAGRPLAGTAVAVLDAGGRPLPPNQVGVIHIGSDLRSDGYSGGGAKRDVGGLLSSGDLGHFDAGGRLFVDGREDEMIVSGGENVYPGEVEDLLARHPAIADVAVRGTEDAEFGQRLQAFVVLRGDGALTSEEIRDHVRAHLARYKVPRDVSFVDELPRNPAGKVLKRELVP